MTTIQQFVHNQGKQLQERTKLALFLNILISILSTNISFKQTMPRSLIPHQTLTKNNSFKTLAEQFVRYFDIDGNQWLSEWNNLSKMASGNCYLPNKHRSSQVFFAYLSYCKNIKHNFFKITSNKQIRFQCIWKKEENVKTKVISA
eukprot:UN07342